MAIIANLFIDQGTDFTVTVDVSDATGGVLDLTGYSTAAQIRKTYGSSNVSAIFTTTTGTPSQGKVTMSLTDTQTSGLSAGRYVYDLNITRHPNKCYGIETNVSLNNKLPYNFYVH